MRQLLVVAVVLVAALAACSDRTPAPEAAPPRDRPLAQDGSVARAVTSTPDRARVQVDLAAVRSALQAYHAEHGAWPRSLDELAFEGRLNYPADLTYDPATGEVHSQTYPSF